MTAGRGIVHSERTGAELRQTGSPIHGLQMWVALPAAKEEMDAGFAHHATAEFPVVQENGKNVRVVVGSLYGASPRYYRAVNARSAARVTGRSAASR